MHQNPSLFEKLSNEGVAFFSNDNISEHVSDSDKTAMVETLSTKFEEILQILGIDTENDHNTHDTSKRMAKMWVLELFRGRYQKAPKLTTFPNVRGYHHMVHVGPIAVKSVCAHHFVPIIGSCHIAIIPEDKLVGLSKYSRVVDWIARRPQIQEEMTNQIAEFINSTLSPRGVAVYIRAKHMCMTCRGVNEPAADTITTSFLGKAFDEESRKIEFFHNVNQCKSTV